MRDVLNDVILKTIVWVQEEATLYPNKLLSKYQDFKTLKIVFPSVADFKTEWIGPRVDRMATEMSLAIKEYLTGWMLQCLQEIKEIIVVNKDWLLMDDSWLSSNILGNIKDKKEKKGGGSADRDFLLSAEDVKGLINSEVFLNNQRDEPLKTLQKTLTFDSLVALLESIGACLRVKTISNGTQNHHGSEVENVSADTEQFLLFFSKV